MLNIAIGILRFFLFQLDPNERTNNEKITKYVCMHARICTDTPASSPSLSWTPQRKTINNKEYMVPSTMSLTQWGLNKYVLSQWNHICQIILLRTEDSYQVLVSLKPVSRALKSDFYSLVFHLQR